MLKSTLNQTPLISIIVPIYNVEKYLYECLESIVNQTYRNLEILLVNDGSPDNSLKICQLYAAKDHRIAIIDKENGGLSSARNAGLDRARGAYLSFIDSDDFVALTYIEKLYKNLGDSDMSICSFHEYYAQKPYSYSKKRDRLLPRHRQYTSEQLISKIHKFKKPLIITAWNKLYKRELWNDLRYPLNRLHEDEFVIHYIVDRCRKITLINENLYFYRQARPGSIMNTPSLNNAKDYYEACIDREAFYNEKGLTQVANRMYNEGTAYYIRRLIKFSSSRGNDIPLARILNDPKLFISLKIELVFKTLRRRLWL